MSIKIKVYNKQVQAVGEIKLSETVFGVPANEALVHQAMITQMANERQVLAHTKNRSEVRGGGRKPWRQKGTGRARHGSIRSPIWIGGGVTFGPRKDRNFAKKINKKMKLKALLMVLSDKIKEHRFIVLEKLEAKEYKTKALDEMITKLEKELNKGTKEQRQKNIKRSILMVNNKKDDKITYSARNLIGVKIINLENINILDLLKHRDVILTKEGVKKLEKKYSSDARNKPPRSGDLHAKK